MFGVYTRNDETKANKRGATLTPCKTNVPPSTLLFEIVRNTWHEINTWKRQNTLDPTLFFLLILSLSLRLFRCSILEKERERERQINYRKRENRGGFMASWNAGVLAAGFLEFRSWYRAWYPFIGFVREDNRERLSGYLSEQVLCEPTIALSIWHSSWDYEVSWRLQNISRFSIEIFLFFFLDLKWNILNFERYLNGRVKNCFVTLLRIYWDNIYILVRIKFLFC